MDSACLASFQTARLMKVKKRTVDILKEKSHLSANSLCGSLFLSVSFSLFVCVCGCLSVFISLRVYVLCLSVSLSLCMCFKSEVCLSGIF